MTFLDENTDRATLETTAIFECKFDLGVIAKSTDEELLDMIRDWIADGDECGAC